MDDEFKEFKEFEEFEEKELEEQKKITVKPVTSKKELRRFQLQELVVYDNTALVYSHKKFLRMKKGKRLANAQQKKYELPDLMRKIV